MTERKRKTCQICGRPYVPTGNMQKYCPDCRKELTKSGSISDAYKAYKKAGAPGPVTVSHIETPETHLMDFVETRQEVGSNESGGSYENVKYYGPQVTMCEEDFAPGIGTGLVGSGGGEGTGGPELEQLVTAETAPKNIDLPDGLAAIEEHAEILRRYYRGELIDKSEFLARIREKLGEF